MPKGSAHCWRSWWQNPGPFIQLSPPSLRTGPCRPYRSHPGASPGALCMSIVGQQSESERGGMATRRAGRAVRESRPPGEAPCLPVLCSLQTDKEQLTAEAKELRQKVKYLQDQLSPLTRQREYQEKEIQRLNKVGASAVVRWAGRASLSQPRCPPCGRCLRPSAQEGRLLGQGEGAEALGAAP